jgi:hypothetical protein
MDASSDTSMAIIRALLASMSLMFSIRLAAPYTMNPSFKSSSAVAFPIPADAPVINTTPFLVVNPRFIPLEITIL